MSDYLWDRSGEPDPDVAALEKLLAPLGAAPVAWGSHPRHSRHLGHPQHLKAFAIYAALAASVALLVGATLISTRVVRPSWNVVSLSGSPRVGERTVTSQGTLPLGGWLETDAASHARIDIGLIGQVDVGPNSRVGLLKTVDNEHRLSMQRGIIEARIWAPPGMFFVETQSATAIDLGCRYTLEMDDGGNGLLRVITGFVGFEYAGRESFVPQGAACKSRPDRGPGTPYYESATPSFLAALDRVDTMRPGTIEYTSALDTVLRDARREDAMTIWHLLVRVDAADRGRLFDRLAALVPAPGHVTRDGILRLDRAMIDRWWDAFELGDTTFWRTWKGPYPLSQPR